MNKLFSLACLPTVAFLIAFSSYAEASFASNDVVREQLDGKSEATKTKKKKKPKPSSDSSSI